MLRVFDWFAIGDGTGMDELHDLWDQEVLQSGEAKSIHIRCGQSAFDSCQYAQLGCVASSHGMAEDESY